MSKTLISELVVLTVLAVALAPVFVPVATKGLVLLLGPQHPWLLARLLPHVGHLVHAAVHGAGWVAKTGVHRAVRWIRRRQRR